MPIVSKVAGDHVEFSFPSTNLKGERIQPQQFATQVQIAVKTHFQKQEFQDNHKVDIYESEIIFENSGDIVFLRPGILEEMRISMGWNTTPLLGEKIPGGIKLLYPRKDGQGKDGQASPQSVSHEDVSAYLANAGIPNRIISSSKQTKRFKMWQPQGSGNIRGDELVFSMNEPAGYEPFRRSLTVSVVVGDHNPIRTLQDVEEFLRLKGDLSESLSQIKHDSWPHKQAMMILPKDKKHGRPVSSPSHGEVRLGGRYRGTSGVIGTFDTSAPITTSLPTIRPKAQLAGGSASHLRTADGTLVAPKIKLTPGVIPIQNQIRKPKFFATFATSRSPFTGAGRTALFLKTPLSRPVFR